MDVKILSFKYEFFFFLTFGFLMKMELLQQQKSVWVKIESEELLQEQKVFR